MPVFKARVHPIGVFICYSFRCYGYWTLFLCCKTESLLRTEVSTFVESSPVLRQMHVLLNFRDFSVFMRACSSFSFILRFTQAYFFLGYLPEFFVTYFYLNVAAAKRAKSYNSLMNIQDKLS